MKNFSKSNLLKKGLLLSIILYLPSCGDQPITTAQDYELNRSPVIKRIWSEPEGGDLLPNMQYIIHVDASDPEGKQLDFNFSTNIGSFSDKTVRNSGARAKYFTPFNLKGGEKVSITVRAADDKGETAVARLNLGDTKQGPAITLKNDLQNIQDGVIYTRSDNPVAMEWSSDSPGFYQVSFISEDDICQIDDYGNFKFYRDPGEVINSNFIAGDPDYSCGSLNDDMCEMCLVFMDTLQQEWQFTFPVRVDDEPPVITGFELIGDNTVYEPDVSLAVEAMDNVGVAKWYVGTSIQIPGNDDPRWQTSIPVIYTLSQYSGNVDLHVWAMDPAGNISSLNQGTSDLSITVNIDFDLDGHWNRTDNCPLIANSSQDDNDNDGYGDACDDTDGDGLLDIEDNCPGTPNKDQADTDGDGVGDICDSIGEVVGIKKAFPLEYKAGFEEPIIYKSKLYFGGTHGTYSMLYVYNGKTIQAVPKGSSDYQRSFKAPFIFNDILYFRGDYGSNYKMYEFDGSEIRNFDYGNSGYSEAFVNQAEYKNKLYFRGNSNGINFLYEYDGNEIKEVSTGASDYNDGFKNVILFNDKLYFNGSDSFKSKIYEIDGDSIKNVPTGISDYSRGFSNAIIYNDSLYFNSDSYESTFYKFNGIEIQNISKGSSNYNKGFDNSVIYNGKLYFKGKSNNEYLIYEYDGNEVRNISSEGSDYMSGFRNTIEANGKLYFEGDQIYLSKIYEFNGIEIKSVSSTGSDYQYNFDNPFLFNGKTYFQGNNGLKNIAYVLDGGNIYNLSSGTSGYQEDFEEPFVFENQLLFKGDVERRWFGVLRDTLYKINGLTISNVSNDSSDYSYGFNNPIKYNNMLYFWGRNGSILFKIYKHDGNKIIDVVDTVSDYYDKFNFPSIYNGNLYFSGRNTNASLDKYFQYDGTDISSVSIGNSDFKNYWPSLEYWDSKFSIEYNNRQYFQGKSNNEDLKMYEYSDEDGEKVIKNITAALSDYEYKFAYPILYSNSLYFQGESNSILKIFRFDGSEIVNVPSEITDYIGDFINPVVYNDKVVFLGSDGSSGKIYCVNSNEVQNISVGISDYHDGYNNPIIYKNKLYFEGHNSSVKLIYEYDGIEISNVKSGLSNYQGRFMSPILFNNKLCFMGDDGSGYTLFEYNGKNISEISLGSSDYQSFYFEFEDSSFFNNYSQKTSFIIFENKLIVWDINDEGLKIYEYDGINIHNIFTGSSDYKSFFFNPILYNNKLYFYGEKDTGYDIGMGDMVFTFYEYDVTEIKNMQLGNTDYQKYFDFPIVYKNRIFFSGMDYSGFMPYTFDINPE